MKHLSAFAAPALVLIFALASCSPGSGEANASASTADGMTESAAPASSGSSPTTQDGAPEAAPAASRAPVSGTSGATPTHATPVALIRDYYAAITAHDYASAYQLWRDEGKASGKSLAAFARGFADTAETKVEFGAPSTPEGAAGSIYVTVPVTVRAMNSNGTPQRFEGQYVLHRANDVPGASRSSRDWRIHSASLKPVG